jgi:hypothetical protein
MWGKEVLHSIIDIKTADSFHCPASQRLDVVKFCYHRCPGFQCDSIMYKSESTWLTLLFTPTNIFLGYPGSKENKMTEDTSNTRKDSFPGYVRKYRGD